MPSKIFSASVFGLDSRIVEVEVDILNGPASITIVGLGDAAVQESKERIRSAIKNSGAEYPRRKKTVNLAPADLRKHGPAFDLPIALGLLLQSAQIPAGALEGCVVLGELALSGALRRIPGVLPMVAHAAEQGFLTAIVPAENAAEAGLVPDIKIIAAENLMAVIAHLRGEEIIESNEEARTHSGIGELGDELGASFKRSGESRPEENWTWRIEDIRGQEHAKRALLIAAAGGHNILLYGPPGSGKTMLARSFQSILPPLSFSEAVEVTKIYSIAGKLPADVSLIHAPPFRAVHHTASAIALTGGGTIPRPGEISLAHRGVLFMDEFLEFPRFALDCLRQPLEDGTINISRAAGSYRFPAEFTLIAATNPCPCGFLNDTEKHCKCSEQQVQQYGKKLSGPLLDRIDLVCSVPRLPIEKIATPGGSETSAMMIKRIQRARQIQRDRYQNDKTTNARLPATKVQEFCQTTPETEKLLHRAFAQMSLSGRAYHKLLKVSRTIADLDGDKLIEPHHLAEALQYRMKTPE